MRMGKRNVKEERRPFFFSTRAIPTEHNVWRHRVGWMLIVEAGVYDVRVCIITERRERKREREKFTFQKSPLHELRNACSTCLG